VVEKDQPANCHATTCDGMGHTQHGADPTNVPASTNPCLVGTCDATGTPSTAPAAAGAACTSSTGGQRCDGMGTCVQCLHDGDCPAMMTCSALHTCNSGSACPTPPCAVGLGCSLDTDCASNACDELSLTCVADQCQDHRKDGGETDVDCGGGTCTPCTTGQMCLIDTDCTTNACDGLSLLCIANRCADHRQDGAETDVDCGGADICPRCLPGKSCLVNGDCQQGHTCSTSTPHVCQ
jgi:hypothetical protein